MLRDLSDTVAFVKVVQCGSFTAAADVLKVPKTRVSRKVRELEERLGVQLLLRTTRRLRLTEAGKVYFEKCQSLVRIVEDAENSVAELQNHPQGWLSITTPHWFGSTVLAPILSEFRERFPDVHPQLYLGNEIVDLIGKEIDLSFRIWMGALPDSSLIARKIGDLPTGIYASPDYVLRRGTPDHPSELRHHDCLVAQVYMASPNVSWPLTGPDGQADYEVVPVVSSSDPDGLHQFLLAGDGLQLTNHIRVKADVDAGRLVRILPQWTGPSPSLYAVQPSGRIQPPKIKAFLDFLIPRITTTLP